MEDVAEEALNQFPDGHEVIVRLQGNADLDRVTSMINLFVRDFGMNLEIRQMNLRECILVGLGSSVKEIMPIGIASSLILGLVTGVRRPGPCCWRAGSKGSSSDSSWE